MQGKRPRRSCRARLGAAFTRSPPVDGCRSDIGEYPGQKLSHQPRHPLADPPVYSLLYVHPPDAFQRLVVAQPAARVPGTITFHFVPRTRPAKATRMINSKVRKCRTRINTSVVNREKRCQPKNGDILLGDSPESTSRNVTGWRFYANPFKMWHLATLRPDPRWSRSGSGEPWQSAS
jgi:hypothetical protein